MSDKEPWPDEVREAFKALEDKYDVEVVSSEHNEMWVNRAEKAEAENERLRKAHGDTIAAIQERNILRNALARAQRKNDHLWAALVEAIDDIEEWGSYASDYFKDKHGLAECIAKHRAALAEKE